MLGKLCQQQETIQNSHIVPRQVSQWIKETSPLGGLRDLEKPNLRQEDTQKSPLLCSDCEQRISVSEGNFAKEIFIPLNDQGIPEITAWYLASTFAVSVGLACNRVFDGLRVKNAQVVPRVGGALQVSAIIFWAHACDTQPYSHHLFFDTQFRVVCMVRQAHADYRYAHRTIDCAIPMVLSEVAIYA